MFPKEVFMWGAIFLPVQAETEKDGKGEGKEESCGLDWYGSYQYEFIISYIYMYVYICVHMYVYMYMYMKHTYTHMYVYTHLKI